MVLSTQFSKRPLADVVEESRDPCEATVRQYAQRILSSGRNDIIEWLISNDYIRFDALTNWRDLFEARNWPLVKALLVNGDRKNLPREEILSLAFNYGNRELFGFLASNFRSLFSTWVDRTLRLAKRNPDKDLMYFLVKDLNLFSENLDKFLTDLVKMGFLSSVQKLVPSKFKRININFSQFFDKLLVANVGNLTSTWETLSYVVSQKAVSLEALTDSQLSTFVATVDQDVLISLVTSGGLGWSTRLCRAICECSKWATLVKLEAAGVSFSEEDLGSMKAKLAVKGDADMEAFLSQKYGISVVRQDPKPFPFSFSF